MTDKIAKNLSPALNEKQAKTLLSLMRDGRLKDSELKEILGFSSVSAAARYRKNLEKGGIIKGYTMIVDWEKLGYKTKFMILVEGEDKEALHEISKDHVMSTEEYLKKMGDILITPTLFGNVILKDVLTSFGEVGIIMGCATSDDAAKSYSELYLKERYPKIKTRLLIIRDITINDFFIQNNFIDMYKKMIKITKRDMTRLKEFRNAFPWGKLKG
jgi:DNA-binding Lrp family transcriptional regulator